MQRVLVASLVVGLATGACDPSTGPDGNGQPASAAIRVLHTEADVPAIDVLVDDAVVLAAVSVGAVSGFTPLADGARRVAFRPAGSATPVPAQVLTLGTGDSLTVLTVRVGSVLNPWVLTDTGRVVPPDRSKLRALHFAATAPALDIWRTQPDWGDPITFMFPHEYREITPYMESDPGTWTVLVSTRRRNAQGVPVLEDTLLITAGIVVPAGRSRTVVVLDAPGGGLAYEVLDP